MLVCVDKVLRKFQTKRGNVISKVLTGADVITVLGDVGEDAQKIEVRPYLKGSDILYVLEEEA